MSEADTPEPEPPTTAELLRDPSAWLEADADGETYLPEEWATPRTYPMILMGSDVRIRLMIWFDANRHRSVSWADIARAFPEDDWEEVVEQVARLYEMTAIRRVKFGRFIFNDELVGRELRDLFFELRAETAPGGEAYA